MRLGNTVRKGHYFKFNFFHTLFNISKHPPIHACNQLYGLKDAK
jgi:hypothetical protein